jgi:hypothetical protein
MRPQHVVLVPGFFGFADLGDLAYFGHVRQLVKAELHRQRLPGEVRVVETYPSASLAKRAVRVLRCVRELLDAHSDGDVHLIGHSSGGLDARLFVSPGVALPTAIEVEHYARRVKTVVTLSSPHHGSPLAPVLGTLLLPEILRLFSLTTLFTLRTSRSHVTKLLARMLAPRPLPTGSGTLLGHLYRDLLSDFSEERREALVRFFVEAASDQDLLGQLGPSGMQSFNRSTPDRPGVRYGSVLTCAPSPGMRSTWASGLSARRQATHALFVALYGVNARAPLKCEVPLTPAQEHRLTHAYGRLPSLGDNDGFVPTRSQVWGEIVHAAWGDHLDTLGHFYQPEHVPPHSDWLNSSARFTRSAFEHMWRSVTRFLFSAPDTAENEERMAVL